MRRIQLDAMLGRPTILDGSLNVATVQWRSVTIAMQQLPRLWVT
jgi:hypothetical protein